MTFTSHTNVLAEHQKAEPKALIHTREPTTTKTSNIIGINQFMAGDWHGPWFWTALELNRFHNEIKISWKEKTELV